MNEIPSDEALLIKDLFIPLLHSSYKCFKGEQQADAVESENQLLTEESYMANTQLPAFIGRFYERENSMLDNTWAVIGGQLPQGAPISPCITQNVDWVLRLTETGPVGNII